MEEYQERVAKELEELDDKRRKLANFQNTCGFSQLAHTEQEILNRQAKCMEEYSFLLGVRLWNWLDR